MVFRGCWKVMGGRGKGRNFSLSFESRLWGKDLGVGGIL